MSGKKKPLTALPDQRGKSAIVTGTGGIGFEAALALTGAGADVIIAGRNAENGAKAILDIRERVPGATVRFELLDLADTDSIAAFCERAKSALTSVDILMCIAGLMMPDGLTRTKEGAETQFAVNYLGHFTLVAGLFPLLKAAPNARVVTVSSVANRPVRFDLRDATATRGYSHPADIATGPGCGATATRGHSASVSYALSKLCCLMFAVELAKRSEENGGGVSAFCVHPGFARTRLFDRSYRFTMILLRVIFFIFPIIRQSAKNAALPALFAVTSQKAVSGGYYGPWFTIMGPPRKALMPLRAKNRELRKALWDLSVSLAGLGPDAFHF